MSFRPLQLRVARGRRLLTVIVGLSVVAAAWGSSLPSHVSAKGESTELGPASARVVAAPASAGGRLTPSRLVKFQPTTNLQRRAPAMPNRFRVPDDGTFARDKALSNASTSVVGPRSPGVRSVEMIPTSADSAIAVNTSFSGMSYELQTSRPFGSDQRVWPPDTQVGVGSIYIIEFVNNSISIWLKSGRLMAVSDLNDFFIPPADSTAFSVSNPRIFFDAASGIWFSSAMAFDAFNNSRVYLNVSLTSDPTGFWDQYSIAADDVGTLFNQPRIGLNRDKIVMTWDDYSIGGFTGSETWVLDKAEIIAGANQPSFWRMGPDPNRFAIVPSATQSDSSTEYLVYNNANPSLSSYLGVPTVGVVAIIGTPALGNVFWAETDASIPDGAQTTVPPDALQPGPGPPIATNDDRLLSAVWQNGTLWAAANDGCTPNGDVTRRSCLRIFEIVTTGVSPRIVQSFDLGSVGEYLSFPSIALDGSGNAFLGFTGSSVSLFPSFLASFVPVGSAVEDQAIALILSAGTGIYDDCAPVCTSSPDNNNRWGDYASAALDPLNPSLVWIAGEFAASATNPLDWGTGVAEISLVVLPTPTTSPTATRSPTPSENDPTATPTESGTGPLSPTPSPTATEVVTGPIPTSTGTATPIWVAVPPGQSTVVSTVIGALPISISIPSGENIAKIGLSAPNSAILVTPVDPIYQPIAGAAIVIEAVDSSGDAISQVAQPIQIAITFQAVLGTPFNPSFAQIYAIDNGSSRLLETNVTALNHGLYVATASTDQLSSFVVLASPVGVVHPQVYLPIAEQGSRGPGW